MRITSRRVSLASLVVVLVFFAALPNAGADRAREKSHGSTPVTADTVAKLDRIILDAAAAKKLQPTDLVDDAVFLRRATVDLIGRIPTLEEYGRYFRTAEDVRRADLVQRLLAHPRFNDRWSLFFADMLRIRSEAPGSAMLGRHVRKALAANQPYDKMIRDMIVGVGSPTDDPALGFLTAERGDPFEMAGLVAQSLLGVRLKCAQCHDHPYDKWTQEDFYGLAAFFGRTTLQYREETGVVRVLESPTSRSTVMWPPTKDDGEQKPMTAHFPFRLAGGDDAALGAAIARRQATQAEQHDEIGNLVDAISERDMDGQLGSTIQSQSETMRREAAGYIPAPVRHELASTLTDPKNQLFARNLVNRIWAQLMGKGIVDPVDDFRDDNPPSNPALLDFLAVEFIAADYDLRALIAMIVSSDAYQRQPLGNVAEQERMAAEDAFVASRLRRMHAEAIYDSLVVAGHLETAKHSPGRNEKEISVRVAVPVEEAITDEEKAAREDGFTRDVRSPEQQKLIDEALAGAYASEIDADLDRLMANDPLMNARAMDDLNHGKAAAMMMVNATPVRGAQSTLRYEFITVSRKIDDNPSFGYTINRLTPAPPEHFLRQFGQSGRLLLGEKRDSEASMRQSLILLNGRLANEAARVGDLEPIHRLLQKDDTLAQAIRMAYIETLTREPTEQELAFSVDLLKSAESRHVGMADLRWALLNSHAFRFLP